MIKASTFKLIFSALLVIGLVACTPITIRPIESAKPTGYVLNNDYTYTQTNGPFSTESKFTIKAGTYVANYESDEHIFYTKTDGKTAFVHELPWETIESPGGFYEYKNDLGRFEIFATARPGLSPYHSPIEAGTPVLREIAIPDDFITKLKRF